MSSPYVVIAICEAKEESADALQALLAESAKLSRAENTCVEYRVHRGLENPQQFFFYERWESKEKHALQFEKPYIKDLIDKLGDILAKPYEIYFSEEIE